jgi:hypothetical protein
MRARPFESLFHAKQKQNVDHRDKSGDGENGKCSRMTMEISHYHGIISGDRRRDHAEVTPRASPAVCTVSA